MWTHIINNVPSHPFAQGIRGDEEPASGRGSCDVEARAALDGLVQDAVSLNA